MDDERITWTSCPHCQDRAAVGWRITTDAEGTVREVPVSFACNGGCTMTGPQILQRFGGGRG